MKNIDLKKILPHLLALALFVGLASVYFYPALQGYRIKQGDIKLHKGMSHELRSHKDKFDEEPLWVGNMFSGMPAYQISSVSYSGDLIEVLHKFLTTWMPHPIALLILYMIGFYILLLCLRIKPWLAIVGAIAFAFSSYFIVIIEAGHNSKAFAIAYMPALLGGIISILRGRWKLGFLLTALFMALELKANHLQITYYLIFVILFVGIGELISAWKRGEQVLFFKRSGIAILAVLLGLLPNLGNILTTYEYSKASTRSATELTVKPDGSSNESIKSSGLEKDYITQWSYGIDESLTLLIPNAKGGASGAVLSDEEAMKEFRTSNPQFFNFMVSQYQNSGWYVNTYWGDMPFTSGPVYVGILICLLAFLSFFYVKDKLVISLALVAFLTLMLSWGKNFMGLTEFFIDYFPMYDKFRAVTMILVIVELVLPILAILFLNKLIQNREEIAANKKKLFIALGSFVGVLLLLWASPESFNNFTSHAEESRFASLMAANPQQSGMLSSHLDTIIEYRKEVFRADVFDRLKFVVLAIALILLFVYGKIKSKVLVVGIGALVLIDLWMLDKEYLNNEENPGVSKLADNRYLSYNKPSNILDPYTASPVDQAILNQELVLHPEINQEIQKSIAEAKKEDPRLSQGRIQGIQFTELMRGTHYRVLNTNARLDEDAQTAYFHKTLGGYHGAKMKKYQELIDFELSIEHYQLKQAFQQGGREMVKQYLPQMNVVNMMNAKYIIGAEAREGGNALVFVENPYRMGNAWFVSKLNKVKTANEVIQGIHDLNPAEEAMIREQDAQNLSSTYPKNQADRIQLKSYLPNKLVYEYTASQKQFAVFSEIFYSGGWKAYINEREIPIYRVNYILRGLEIPAGQGKIIFKFEPGLVALGNTLSIISSVIFLLLFAGFIYQSYRKK